MTGYLLDTNAWIAFLKNDARVVEAVRRHGVGAIHLCAPVWAELWFGACNSQRVAENQARLRELAAHVVSLPLTIEPPSIAAKSALCSAVPVSRLDPTISRSPRSRDRQGCAW